MGLRFSRRAQRPSADSRTGFPLEGTHASLVAVVPPDDRDKLPDPVRDLLLGPVDSFEKLELVVALHGAGSPLTLGALAARACLAVEQVDTAAAGLTAAGLLERTAPDTWRIVAAFLPLVGDLAAVWNTRRPVVLKVMTDRALGRIRASAARVFADAFRLRRRDREGGDDDG
jgi:hypothetical protein